MPRNKAPQIIHHPDPPKVCPKPNCHGTSFIPHEDGWQCLNCMKIIYRYQPLPYISNNRPERVGHYDFQKSPDAGEDAPEDEAKYQKTSCELKAKQAVKEKSKMPGDDSWERYAEYQNIIIDILSLPGVYRWARKHLILNEST